MLLNLTRKIVTFPTFSGEYHVLHGRIHGCYDNRKVESAQTDCIENSNNNWFHTSQVTFQTS